MELNAAQIKAFVEIVRQKSFSKAAQKLYLTQPALSLRLRQLEEQLECSLLKRGRNGIEVTDAGYRVLKYAHIQNALEKELVFDYLDNSKTLRGTLRVAGHYSIVNHVALPALRNLLLENPMVQIEGIVREDDELPDILLKGLADFVFLQKPIDHPGFHSECLGSEEYVAIEPAEASTRSNTYFDSDPSDVITDDFFKLQKGERPSFVRSFMQNEAGILRAVELGLGRAIIAKNEITAGRAVKRTRGLKPLLLPSHLHFAEQPYYTVLQLKAREALIKRSKKLLSTKLDGK